MTGYPLISSSMVRVSSAGDSSPKVPAKKDPFDLEGDVPPASARDSDIAVEGASLPSAVPHSPTTSIGGPTGDTVVAVKTKIVKWATTAQRRSLSSSAWTQYTDETLVFPAWSEEQEELKRKRPTLTARGDMASIETTAQTCSRTNKPIVSSLHFIREQLRPPTNTSFRNSWRHLSGSLQLLWARKEA